MTTYKGIKLIEPDGRTRTWFYPQQRALIDLFHKKITYDQIGLDMTVKFKSEFRASSCAFYLVKLGLISQATAEQVQATCNKKASNLRRIATRNKGTPGFVSDILKQGILDRDGRKCTYCNRLATTVDHVVPVSNGGDATGDNLVACCRICNSKKSNGQLVVIRENCFGSLFSDGRIVRLLKWSP